MTRSHLPRRAPRSALCGLGLIGLAVLSAGLAACDDSGSGPSATEPRTSSTIRRHHRPPRSTTTSSSIVTSSTTASSSSTSPTVPSSIPTPPSPDTCGPRAGAIYAAVQGGDLGPVPLGDYEITECRIAASNQIWSAVTLKPVPGSAVVQLTVALQRIGSIWTVHAYGPDHVGCDAPPPVPSELRLGC